MLKPIHTTTIYGPTLEAVKRDALAEADRITERGDNFVRIEVDKDKAEAREAQRLAEEPEACPQRRSNWRRVFRLSPWRWDRTHPAQHVAL